MLFSRLLAHLLRWLWSGCWMGCWKKSSRSFAGEHLWYGPGGYGVTSSVVPHTPVCHRLGVGSCKEYCLYASEETPFETTNPHHFMSLFGLPFIGDLRYSTRILLDLYVGSPRSLLMSSLPDVSLCSLTAMRPCGANIYPYRCSTTTEYEARSPVWIRRGVILFRLWTELMRLLWLVGNPTDPLFPGS